MNSCTQIYLNTHTHTHTHIYIYIYTHTHAHTHIYIYMHFKIHAYMYTEIFIPIYCVRRVSFKLSISYMCFVWFRFCLLCSKLESFGNCLRENVHHDVISSSRNKETEVALLTSIQEFHSV